MRIIAIWSYLHDSVLRRIDISFDIDAGSLKDLLKYFVKIRTVSETARQGYIKDIVVAGYQQGRGMLHSYPVNIVG